VIAGPKGQARLHYNGRSQSMALSPGARIGSYEIVSPLGVGGMGEVYRAHDMRLKRDVAIKVLPEAFAQDSDRLGRFQREAELLASLNHPNIAAIYGLEKGEAGIAIVLELIEGETLADVIARGAIPIDDALQIVRAMADALEAAHDKGIVHRDLKPANVKITGDGKVKVLDFGLAKAIDQTTGSGSLAHNQLTASPTLTLHATYAGVILGTAAYMSPEQARGKAVDRRTDIWAFGCVLFEMLTGKQTFDAGETVSDAIAAILKHDPDWSALPADTPIHIRTLLKRCLQKDPQKRLPHIGVARLEIDEGPAHVAIERAPTVTPRPLWRRIAPLALTAAATALLAVLAMWMLRSPSPTPVVARFTYMLPEGQAFRDLFLPLVAISPDGTQMAYVANQRLFVRSMSDSNARPIAGAEGEEAGNFGDPVFSPDGQSIAYWVRAAGLPNDVGTIKRVRLIGGAPVTLAQVRRPLGMSWTGNAILVGQPANDGILRVSLDGGMPERIVTAKPGELMQGPQLLPGGDAVLFTLGSAPTSPTALISDDTWLKSHIVVQDLKSGERKTLIDGGTAAHYLPTGHLVYAVGGVLMGRPFDARRRNVVGAANAVIEGIAPTRLSQFATGSVQMSVSDTGSLVYMPGPATISAAELRDLVVVDRSGTTQTLKLDPRPYEHPRVSPNGKQIAFDTDDGKDAIIWIYDLSGTTAPRPLTLASEGKNRYPVWSHDGNHVAFQSDRDGDAAIYWQSADGGTSAERLMTPERGVSPVPDFSTPDGKQLLFQRGGTSSGGPNRAELRTLATLWTFSFAEKKSASLNGVPESITGVAPIGATVSSDGQWVAYSIGADTSRAAIQLYVRGFPSGLPHLIASGATDQMWSQTSKELFFNNLVTGGAYSMTITTQPHFESGNPTPLPMTLTNVFRRARTGPGSPRNIDIMPDGQHFVAAVRREGPNAGPPQINVVLNWFEELKSRVPLR
jgi:eukaryotic-like serine/threonine-protein kinase